MNNSTLSRLPPPPAGRALPAAATPARPQGSAGSASTAASALPGNFARLLQQVHAHKADAPAARAPESPPAPRSDQDTGMAGTSAHKPRPSGAGTAGTGRPSADADGSEAISGDAGTALQTSGGLVQKSLKPLAHPALPAATGRPDAMVKAAVNPCIDPGEPDRKSADASDGAADAGKEDPAVAVADPATLLTGLAAAASASASAPGSAPACNSASAPDPDSVSAPVSAADNAAAAGAVANAGAAAATHFSIPLAAAAGGIPGAASVDTAMAPGGRAAVAVDGSTARATSTLPSAGTPAQAQASASPTATATATDKPADVATAAARRPGETGSRDPRPQDAPASPATWPLAAATAGLAGTLPPAAAVATPATGSLAAPPGSPGFVPQLATQISTFVRNGVHHARLELNPAEMGPLTVQIRLDAVSAQFGGQAAQPVEVHLAAEHAATRQALERAMPELAGSLREAGLTLSGGGVFEQPRQPQPGSGDGGSRGNGRGQAAPGRADTLSGAVGPGRQQAVARQRGVVDLVA